jgi:ETC complex I subunit conserved region
MKARIYKPSKTAMQSGRAKTQDWVLEFEQTAPRTIDPLMGWTSSSDTRQQVRLTFATKEEAIAYAERNRIDYVLFKPREQKRRAMSYSDNFRYDRIGLWTH